jgi:hypothetical protein
VTVASRFDSWCQSEGEAVDRLRQDYFFNELSFYLELQLLMRSCGILMSDDESR